ncbi:hypothetical protein [Sansalvadorimonas verongulae]|uniref:hypothetical protein n=1 Tax=Sansalvadorimonas verongulae TaxID=2172824 RepID=UPI0012BB8B1E|nr:hypothetical protein [Sansalvadorimonas verongulae]MTI13894.1 hypothetical protein [Sansalvadorimonas verongulae]
MTQIEDTALMRALALAAHYKQNESYVSRILRLMMLSPVLQEKVLNGESIGRFYGWRIGVMEGSIGVTGVETGMTRPSQSTRKAPLFPRPS